MGKIAHVFVHPLLQQVVADPKAQQDNVREISPFFEVHCDPLARRQSVMILEVANLAKDFHGLGIGQRVVLA